MGVTNKNNMNNIWLRKAQVAPPVANFAGLHYLFIYFLLAMGNGNEDKFSRRSSKIEHLVTNRQMPSQIFTCDPYYHWNLFTVIYVSVSVD